MENVEQFKKSYEKSATIISCLLEFSSIEQAFAKARADKVKIEILHNDISSASIPTIKTTKNAGRNKNKSAFFPSGTVDQRLNDKSDFDFSVPGSRQQSVEPGFNNGASRRELLSTNEPNVIIYRGN